MLGFISSSTSLPRDNQLIKVKLQKDRRAYYAAGFTCILNHAQGQRSSAEAPPAAPQASAAAMAPPNVIVSAPREPPRLAKWNMPTIISYEMVEAGGTIPRLCLEPNPILKSLMGGGHFPT